MVLERSTRRQHGMEDGSSARARARAGVPALTLAALGIVFGDIGTSPLYAMRETFTAPHHELAVSDANVYGVLSLVFWSLILVVSVKYLLFVTRADNEGEGGIMALIALLRPSPEPRSGPRWVLLLVGIFGAALLFGDAVITPSISVLSAVEGAEVAAPALDRWVVPASIVILVALFAVQRRGTAAIGSFFGPVMVVWFGTLAVLGVVQITKHPSVVEAVNPLYAADFFAAHTFEGFLALGSVVLVITGAESLYADLGHFGRPPIARAWFAVALPALALNYFGQGALLLDRPSAVEAPLFQMVPDAGIVPLTVLATLAAVIASQALISGVFSITNQAIQLGYAPRHRIRHTSPTAFGQIYIPLVNWALMAACLALVVGFGSSGDLASAYGVAVTSTMVITTVLFYVVLRERFGWRRVPALALCGVFLAIDLAFFGANLFKIPSGGWFPLVVAIGMFTLMTTWHTGRRLVFERIRRNDIPLAEYVHSLVRSDDPPRRVPGTAVYLFSTPGLTPPALISNVRHNRVLHEQVIVLSIVTVMRPRVLPAQRARVLHLEAGVVQLTLEYGFMEDPDVPSGLQQGAASKLNVDPSSSAFILGSEQIAISTASGMAVWRDHLFAFLVRNATPAAAYFGLPLARTITIATPVEV